MIENMTSGGAAVADINYVTAKNLAAVDASAPHPVLTAATRRDAHAQAITMRMATREILGHATRGAKDLMGGNHWSRNIEMFESLSMEQARVLAKFPVGTNHPEFGKLVFRARKNFVAFRESVRREIIGNIHTDTGKPDFDKALEKIAEHAAQTVDSLKSIELALADG